MEYFGMKKASCGDCKFFKYDNDARFSKWSDGCVTEDKSGRCRRYPPKGTEDLDLLYRVPATTADDWCGEHISK